MTTMTAKELRSWVGHRAVDPRGGKVGEITDIYVDDETRQPEWLAVKTGRFGGNVNFVPLAGASTQGDEVRLAYEKEIVEEAPNVPADGEISRREEDELYRHYGYGHQDVPATGSPTTTGRARRSKGDAGGDEAMTRSEEELDIDRKRRPAEKVRLHKWVETEDVEVTVPVQRERARVVTEPVTDANRDAAMSGQDIRESDHEMVLQEEEIEVGKKTVPKERVRLEKETETEQATVSDEVRKERIERQDRKA